MCELLIMGGNLNLDFIKFRYGLKMSGIQQFVFVPNFLTLVVFEEYISLGLIAVF